MYLLCMIKATIRWCTCRVENILTLGKLLSLWFCFLLYSILFLIYQTSYHTYKIISSYELARPVMGPNYLVIGRAKRAPHWAGVQSRFRVILLGERSEPHTGVFNRDFALYIYVYSILHILTIVFHGTLTVEYQPIFHGVT